MQQGRNVNKHKVTTYARPFLLSTQEYKDTFEQALINHFSLECDKRLTYVANNG